GRVSQWRARRTGELQQPSSTRSISPLPEPPRLETPRPATRNSKPLEPIKPAPIPFEPRIRISDSAPLPAPKAPPPSSQTGADEAATKQSPPWRAQLKERVKQTRDRRATGAVAVEPEPDEAELDPNPIVESALRRIQWAKHAPSASAAPRI